MQPQVTALNRGVFCEMEEQHACSLTSYPRPQPCGQLVWSTTCVQNIHFYFRFRIRPNSEYEIGNL